MANQDLTVFQKLTKIFGFQNKGEQSPPSFNFSREELLKTDDPIEFEKAKLQAQQSQLKQESGIEQSIGDKETFTGKELLKQLTPKDIEKLNKGIFLIKSVLAHQIVPDQHPLCQLAPTVSYPASSDLTHSCQFLIFQYSKYSFHFSAIGHVSSHRWVIPLVWK